MKKAVNKILALAIAVASVITPLGGIAEYAYAEEVDSSKITGGFTVSPPNQVVTLVPGEKYEYSIEVFNPSAATEDIDVKAVVKPFGINKDSEDYDFDFDTVSNYNQMMDWIEVENPTATVSPNNRAYINYTISVPENAPAGGQYASIGIQRLPRSTGGGGVNIAETMEIASLIYATVLGETTESGNILANNITGMSFDAKIKADALVSNTGNVHSTAKYKLQVYPLFSNEEMYTNEEKPDSIVVIPGQTYRNFIQWDSPLVGIFKVVQTVEFAGTINTATKTVIVCPIWLIVIIVAVILLIVFYLTSSSKKRKNAKRK